MNYEKKNFAFLIAVSQVIPSFFSSKAYSKTTSEIVGEALLLSRHKNLKPYCQNPKLKNQLFGDLEKIKQNASKNMNKLELDFNNQIELREKQRSSANIIKGSAAVGSIFIGGVAFKIGKTLFLESRGMIAGLNQIQRTAHPSFTNMMYQSQKSYRNRAIAGTSLAAFTGVYSGLYTYSADIYSKEIPKPVLDAFNKTVEIASANTNYNLKETQKMFLRGHQEILESRETGKSSGGSKIYTLGSDFATDAAVDAASSISRMRLYRLEYNYAENYIKDVQDHCKSKSDIVEQEFTFMNSSKIKSMNFQLYDGKLGGEKTRSAK